MPLPKHRPCPRARASAVGRSGLAVAFLAAGACGLAAMRPDLALGATTASLAMCAGVSLGAALGYALAHLTARREVRDLRTAYGIDELTGLPNARALRADLAEIRRGTPDAVAYAVILIDVDNFRDLNHRFSYSVADGVLATIGEVLRRDNRITDATYRYFERGDEFLLLARATSLDEAHRAAERKREHIAATAFAADGEPVRVTVSCGVGSCGPGEDIEGAIARANEALRAAKETPHKNCTVVSDGPTTVVPPGHAFDSRPDAKRPPAARPTGVPEAQ